jgi:ubiquitin-protein ligase
MAIEMRVRVKDPRTSNECELEIMNNHIISDIIRVAVDQFELQTQNYFLTRQGTVLNSEARVEESEIEHNDILIISPDPVGGAVLPEPVWEKRLDNEVEQINQANFYKLEVTDDGPPKTARTIVAHLSDAPAYRKTNEESDLVLVKEHILEVQLDRSYPDSPPKVRFLSDIFHPNVFVGSGDVCIGMLGNWENGYFIIQLIQAIDQLLSAPNCEDPANRDACDYYKKNPVSPPNRPWHGGGATEFDDPRNGNMDQLDTRPRVVSKPRVVSMPRVVRP